MNLHWIDALIVFGLLGVVVAAAAATRKYTRTVADFLSANRCAGRYLLCVASGMGNLGAVSIVASFELYSTAGFTAVWWTLMLTPLSLLLAISGWLIYRFRETRALTLAQFFEMRYSRNFRVFAGILGWLSGIINFGIFPAVGARFFVYFLGLPPCFVTLGTLEVSITLAAIMAVLLGISLIMVFSGGQIAVLVTDFLQGVFTNVAFLIILIYLFIKFPWSTIVETLKKAPADASLIHPFHATQLPDFNYFYFLIGGLVAVYTFKLAWQGTQAINSSAISPHEAKMAAILGEWRGMVTLLVVMMLPIAAYVAMHDPAYAALADDAQQALGKIDNDQIRQEVAVSVALAKMLPTGIVGLLCAVMLAAFVATHNAYLHSWGSIFVQDVILPFRRQPFTPRQHLWLLRASILFVAVFAFIFSLLFQQNERILLFFAVSGAIFLGGAGSAIIGGLYWRNGSTAGAWAAMLTGAILSLGSLVLRQLWPGTMYPWLAVHAPTVLHHLTWALEGAAAAVPGINWKVTPEAFPIDSQWVFFFTIIASAAMYITFSLISTLVLRRPSVDLDRLLFRGDFAPTGDSKHNYIRPTMGLRAILPTREFSLGDKFIYFGQITWTLVWFTMFLIGTAYNLMCDVSDDSWARFWWWYVVCSFVAGASTTIWFLCGGMLDLRAMIAALSRVQCDITDDGTVVHDEERRIVGH